MERAAKIRKTANVADCGKSPFEGSKPPPPIVYTVPGFILDVRLNVFGQEYHCHSAVLKLHSNFFRRFLESPDKLPALVNSAFKYEYISVVDDDGEWGLEVARPGIINTTANGLKAYRTKSSENVAMQSLLCAIYSRLYTISSFTHFQDLVRLADFYCALPIVSNSLYAALWRSPNFVSQIGNQALPILKLSKKLRHPLLFREAMVYFVSDWTLNSERQLDQLDFEGDKDLRYAIIAAHSSLKSVVLKAHYEILLLICDGCYTDKNSLKWMDFFGNRGFNDPLKLACEFRELHNHYVTEHLDEGLDHNQEPLKSLNAVLRSNLVLDQGLNIVGNFLQVGFGKSFLCATLADEDLPWGDESDW